MPLRWGILSTANITDKLLDSGTDQEFVAVGSRDGARAEAYAREKGIARAHGSYEALLADPDVDAIYNPLPNSMHVEWSIRALRGRQARPVREAAHAPPRGRRPRLRRRRARGPRAGRGLHVAPPPAGRARPRARSTAGAIGDLRVIRAHFAFTAADPDDIRLQAALDGGGLMDVGCYCVSGCRTLAGAEPERASAELVPGGRRRRRGARRHPALPRRRARPLRLRADLPGRPRARGRRHRRLARSSPTPGTATTRSSSSAAPTAPSSASRPGPPTPTRSSWPTSRPPSRGEQPAAARPRRRARPGPHDRRALHLRRKERPMPDRLKTSLGHLGPGRDGHPLRARRLPARARLRVDAPTRSAARSTASAT